MIDGDEFEWLAHRLGLVYADTHNLAKCDLQGVVLSHNSDGCIVPPGTATREYDFVWNAERIPDGVVHWFGQNVDITDSRLTPIPIGLERDRWHPEQRKKEVIRTTPRGDKTGLMYLNVNTRIVSQREALYEWFEDLPWVTAERGYNGLDFEHYARQIAAHKFVLCPSGNGLDTHRTWETLYLGAFPIVLRHVFTEAFAEQLPLLIIDDWADVTDHLLERVYADFTQKEWNWDALTMDYWEKLIRSKISGT